MRDDHVHEVAFLHDGVAVRHHPVAEPGQEGDAGMPACVPPCGRRGRPTHDVATSTSASADAAGRVAPLGLEPLGQQPAQDLVGRPPHGGDRRDAEFLVDRRAPGS